MICTAVPLVAGKVICLQLDHFDQLGLIQLLYFEVQGK